MLVDLPEKYLRTASDRRAVELGCRWSPRAIEHVERFASTLKNPMDSSQVYRLLHWQHYLTACLFGWRWPDGRRRFTRLHLWLPKKNGKTSYLAFLNLVMLLADGEKRPGCYPVSTSGANCEELYVEAKSMLAGTLWMKSGAVELIEYRKRIECPANGGIFQTLTTSSEAAEGLKGSMVTVDEAHASLTKKPKIYASLRYAGTGRRQPIAAVISTAGDNRQSLPYRIYSRDKKIVSGELIDVETLAIIYEAEDKASFSDDDFARANPSIGQIQTIDQIRSDYEEARSSEYALEDFKRYRLNIWTKRATSWLSTAQWDKCRGELPPLAGKKAYIGVDLSGALDLTAVVAVVPMDDGTCVYLPHFWLPDSGIEDRCRKEIDYIAAARAGQLTLCGGQLVDYSLVEQHIRDFESAGLEIAGIGFDPWRAKEIAQRLEESGMPVFAIKQGWGMSEPSLKLQGMIETQQALHAGNAVMSWCVENVEIRRDGNGKIRPVKPIEKHKRIDGVIAAIMGTNLAMFAKDEEFVCG